jgi:hypothetical protein
MDRERRDRLAMFADLIRAEIELEQSQSTRVDKTLNELVTRVESEKGGAKRTPKPAAGS